MKKIIFAIWWFLIVPLALIYAGLAIYYHNAFEYGTWINGVYCTGKSIEQVNAELCAQMSYAGLSVDDGAGGTFYIAADDIDYTWDFTEPLTVYRSSQNSWLWIRSLWKVENHIVSPAISYDEKSLDAILSEVSVLAEAKPDSALQISLIKNANGYELINERTNVLDTDEAKQMIADALLSGEKEISLESCYHDLPLTDVMENTLALWEKISAFQDCHIVYQMGKDEIALDASIVCDWILLDEDGNFALDENGDLQLDPDAVVSFITSLAEAYDTVGSTRTFHATRGETVTIEGGTYGNQLDQETEIEWLTDAFVSGVSEVHTPAFLQEAWGWVSGRNDIGDTYIEVDMGEQMMYYYQDGKLVIETPIVSGSISGGHATPAGVNYVYVKQTDRILRGEGYASHVDYWMPVKGNIGIHDADWRSSFGGTIYKTNGSHGCINTPPSVMKELFPMVEVGTPVVMFY